MSYEPTFSARFLVAYFGLCSDFCYLLQELLQLSRNIAGVTERSGEKVWGLRSGLFLCKGHGLISVKMLSEDVYVRKYWEESEQSLFFTNCLDQFIKPLVCNYTPLYLRPEPLSHQWLICAALHQVLVVVEACVTVQSCIDCHQQRLFVSWCSQQIGNQVFIFKSTFWSNWFASRVICDKNSL